MGVQTGVVTQVNINQVIDASKDIETIAPIILSLGQKINALANDKAFKNSSDTLAGLANVSNVTKNYCMILDDVLNTIVQKDGDNVKNLADLLGRVSKPDPKDNKKTIEKWTVVDAAMQIPNIIDTVFKVMDSVANFEFGRQKLRKMKRNIAALKVGLSDVFATIIDVFTEISESTDLRKVLDVLCSEPDTITKIIQNDTGDESEQTDQFKRKNKVWDKSKVEETTAHGKMGLLDAMEKIFTLVGVMSSLKAPKLLNLRFQLLKIGHGIKMVYDTLTTSLDQYSGEKSRTKIINIGKLLDGDENTETPGLGDLFISVSSMFKRIDSMKFNWVSFKLTQFAIRRLFKLASEIIDMTNKPEFIQFGGKVVDDKIKKFSNSMNHVLGIFSAFSDNMLAIIFFGVAHKQVKKAFTLLIHIARTISVIDKVKVPSDTTKFEQINGIMDHVIEIQQKMSVSISYFLTGWLGFFLLKRFIRKLPKLLIEIEKLSVQLKDHTEVVNKIKTIATIVTAIVGIQRDILIAAVLTIPASIAMVGLWIFTWTLVLFVGALCKMVENEKFSTSIDTASKNILKISQIILSLLIVSGTILIFALIAPLMYKVIVENLLPFGLMLLLTIGFIVGMMFLAKLMSKVAAKLSRNVAINVLIMCGMFIVAALAILVTAAVGEKFRSGAVWANLGIGIGVIILVSALMVGLGIALSSAAPFIGMAAAGIAPLLALLGLILAAGLTIVAIGAIPFDFGTYTKGKNPAKGEFGTGTKAAGNVGLTFEFVKFLNEQIGKGFTKEDRKKMKSAKKMLRQVKGTVKNILKIAETLQKLQNLGELDTVIITQNVTTMFNFINHLEGKIVEAITDKSDVSTEDIIDGAKAKKKQWKKSKKMLSKVEAVIAMIGGITETMLILKDFKFEDEKKDKDGNILSKSTQDIITDNVTALFTLIDTVSKQINGNKVNVSADYMASLQVLADSICAVNESFEGIAGADPTKLKTNIGTYDEFVESVNKIEINKLTTATDMFKQMNSFSSSIKGNFDKLAAALSDKLLPVLEELKEVMGIIPEKIEQSSQNISTSVRVANSPNTKENMTTQAKIENPNMTEEQVDNIVKQRMAEKAKEDASGVTAKLDELLTLLKGYSGEYVMVEAVR